MGQLPALTASAPAAPMPAPTRRVEHIMGMPITIDVRDDIDHRAFDAAFDWLRRVDAMFSTYRRDSEVSRLNRGELVPAEVSGHVHTVLVRCEQLRRETGGYFDAHYGADGAIDPSGLVKGWAVDRAACILDAHGARNYAVNAGGDVRVRGAALPDPRWRVGVRHPEIADRLAAVVEARDLAIATSGAYERGDHVIDPHARRPPENVTSVTITGPDLATADAYATAAFAMGAAGPDWTRRLSGWEAMTVLDDGTCLFTPNFPVAA